MDKRSKGIKKQKKVLAVLVAIFLLCNIIFVTPVFASPNEQQTPQGTHSCWPFWPFCTPSSTPNPTSTPTPGQTPTPGSTRTPVPTPGTPGPRPTVIPTRGPTPTPTPTRPPIHLAAATSFTLTATQIIGTNAHLSLLPDPLHPVLTFTAVTMQGMRITHFAFTLSASGTVTGSGVAIKTSVFQEFLSALGSFTNKADLLILLAGGTVHTLTMTNVTLQIDRYINAQSLILRGLNLSI